MAVEFRSHPIFGDPHEYAKRLALEIDTDIVNTLLQEQGVNRLITPEEFARGLARVFNGEEEKMNETMTFSEALEHIKAGQRAQRTGWNGKGMFVFLVPGSRFKVNRPPLLGIYPEGAWINYRGHIDMRAADGTIVPWLASQSDLLEDDWQLVEAAP